MDHGPLARALGTNHADHFHPGRRSQALLKSFKDSFQPFFVKQTSIAIQNFQGKAIHEVLRHKAREIAQTWTEPPVVGKLSNQLGQPQPAVNSEICLWLVCMAILQPASTMPVEVHAEMRGAMYR